MSMARVWFAGEGGVGGGEGDGEGGGGGGAWRCSLPGRSGDQFFHILVGVGPGM